VTDEDDGGTKATTAAPAGKKRKLEEPACSDAKPVSAVTSFRQTLVAETLGKCSTTKTLSQAEFEDQLALMLVEDIEGSVHKGSISIYFRFWVFYTIRKISTSPTSLRRQFF